MDRKHREEVDAELAQLSHERWRTAQSVMAGRFLSAMLATFLLYSFVCGFTLLRTCSGPSMPSYVSSTGFIISIAQKCGRASLTL